MSGSIQDQIANLELDVADLTAQVAVDEVSDPSAVPALEAEITLDNQEIVQLQALICFANGTNILTDRGEVAVQDLKVGDLVVTPHGPTDTMPVRWIGRQHFEGQAARFAQPILVRVGALGDGLPHRDLRLSGDHCLYLGGRLVPVKFLANGASIIAEKGHETIDYVNFELDRHGVVLAEGAESETYLDCGNRGRFDNAGEASGWLASRPERDGSAWHDGSAFAPPLWDGPELVALRERLASAGGHAIAA